ncbi:MAG: hypothetical protein JWO57_803 [Pseudonocardiales bacterium]|nr:hypothetical protein [Pseudonocardiales bacterium]
MDNAYFHVVDENPAAGSYQADPATGGPWDPRLQHGGPPGALLVHAAERLAAAETGRDDLVALRLAAEFVGPVPVAEIATTARIVRAARAAVLVDVVLSAAGRDCLQARIWLVRDADTTAIAAAPVGPAARPTGRPGLGFAFPYGDSMEWVGVHGGLSQPGPAAVWARPGRPLLAGWALSGLQRAALVGDSASGVSSELDWSQWSFLNIDLDVHLIRPVRGEWLLLDALTQLGPAGSALARSTLSDGHGPVGSTAQTLILERRR